MLKTKLEVVQGDMKAGAGMQDGNGSATLAKQVQKEKGSEGQDPARDDVADGGGLVGLFLPDPKVDVNEQEEVRTYLLLKIVWVEKFLEYLAVFNQKSVLPTFHFLCSYLA